MHIVDVDMSLLERDLLEAARGDTMVHLHEGDSSSYLDSLPEHTFDWVYIDGDHSLEGVQRDAAAALRAIKPDGLLLFNDYTPYSPLELYPYGIPRVVHDLCLDHGFEILYFALEPRGYHDVVLRRRR
jgi:SAM-dependent methyltransferase